MSETTSRVLLTSVCCSSLREIKGAGPTTMAIETWSDGISRFQWLVDDRPIGSIDLSLNAFAYLLQTLPDWFTAMGKPQVYATDTSDFRLFCVHFGDAPEIGLGILGPDETAGALAMVTLDRGEAISMLDDIGRCLVVVHEAGDYIGRDAGEPDDNELDDDEPDADDPFTGINPFIKH